MSIMQTKTQLKSLARMRQRGALLIEALIVIMSMVLIMMCIMFFHGLYVSKHDTIQAARSQAWQAALPGCKFRSVCNLPDSDGASSRFVGGNHYVAWSGNVSTELTVTCNEFYYGNQDVGDGVDTLIRDIFVAGARSIFNELSGGIMSLINNGGSPMDSAGNAARNRVNHDIECIFGVEGVL